MNSGSDTPSSSDDDVYTPDEEVALLGTSNDTVSSCVKTIESASVPKLSRLWNLCTYAVRRAISGYCSSQEDAWIEASVYGTERADDYNRSAIQALIEPFGRQLRRSKVIYMKEVDDFF